MKQILVMMAAVVLVGCGKDTPETSQAVEAEVQVTPAPTPEPVSPVDQKLIVEKAVRKSLKKPKGQLTEADLAKVTAIRNVTQITDTGLKEVAKLQQLTVLNLGSLKITDVGLKEVAKLQNLKHLWLDNTRITDAGLMEIAKLQKLEGLYLEGTRITDAGLRELAKLQNLKGLSLEDTRITDAGLKNVARLENLQDLWLHNTSITDVGLKEVAKMKQLKSVSMFTGGGAPWTYGAETRATFTRAGMAELRKALPNCRFNP